MTEAKNVGRNRAAGLIERDENDWQGRGMRPGWGILAACVRGPRYMRVQVTDGACGCMRREERAGRRTIACSALVAATGVRMIPYCRVLFCSLYL